jgi:dolichol kinase
MCRAGVSEHGETRTGFAVFSLGAPELAFVFLQVFLEALEIGDGCAGVAGHAVQDHEAASLGRGG